MRQIVGALALPCPLKYFDVSQRLFNWYKLSNFPEKTLLFFPPAPCSLPPAYTVIVYFFSWKFLNPGALVKTQPR